MQSDLQDLHKIFLIESITKNKDLGRGDQEEMFRREMTERRSDGKAGQAAAASSLVFVAEHPPARRAHKMHFKSALLLLERLHRCRQMR